LQTVPCLLIKLYRLNWLNILTFHIRKHNEMSHTNISFIPDNTSASRNAQNATNLQKHIVKNDAAVTGACNQRCPFCKMAGLHKTRSSFTIACFIYFIDLFAYRFTRSGEKSATTNCCLTCRQQ